MLQFLVLSLLLSDFIIADEFTCTQSQLRQSLPHLKVILSARNYDKLHLLSLQLTKESNESQGKGIKSSVQIGSMIADVVDEAERSKCLAALQIQHGYFSMTDRRISSFLALDQVAVEKIRSINRKAVADMTDRVKRMKDSDSFNTVFAELKQLYDKALVAVKVEMTEVQRSKLNDLYRGYVHDTAVRSLLLRFIREKTKDEASAKFYRDYLPNLQPYMTSGGLIIMDFKIAREFLGLDKEQEQAVLDLFEDYSDAVKEVQLALAGAIGGSSDEAIRFHMSMAMKLGSEYGDRFRKLLRDDQMKKVPQLLAQVHGYKYSFTPPIKQQLGITQEQDNGVIKFMNHQQTKFPEAIKNAGLDYEKQYQQHLFLSKAVCDEMLTEEQRELWKKVTGKPIPEKDLKPIILAILQRTNLFIKNPVKK